MNKIKSGFLLVEKPKGWTSFDVCAKLKRFVGTKRVGHTGTLDPFATGLLIIAFGKATKLIPYFEKDKKKYRTKILFGKTSDTLDPEGDIILDENFVGAIINRPILEKILAENFSGKISQIPPKYSALKINGKRAYELARAGKEFEIKKRETEIFSTKILNLGSDFAEIELEVAAGFYIRSFARDLAEKLGTMGMCETLERIAVGAINNHPNDENNSVLSFPRRRESSSENNPLKILNLEKFISVSENSPEEISEYIIDAQNLLEKLEVLAIEESRLDDFSSGRSFKLDIEKIKNLKEGDFFLVVLESEKNKTIGMGELKFGNLQPRIVF